MKAAGVAEETAGETTAVTDTDFYRLGLNGKPGSAELRKRLAEALNLPPRMSRGDLQKAASFLLSREELETLVSRLTTE